MTDHAVASESTSSQVGVGSLAPPQHCEPAQKFYGTVHRSPLMTTALPFVTIVPLTLFDDISMSAPTG